MASSPQRLVSWLSTKIRARVSDALSFGNGPSAGGGTSNGAATIDETLSAVEKVRQYAESPQLQQRMYVVRELLELGQAAGPAACCSDVVPAIEKLVQDVEPSVRQSLVESLPAFCLWMKLNLSLELYTTNVLHILLPLVAELTTDDNPQTRAAAVTALVDVAKAVRHEDLVPYLIPIIRSLAKDRTEEEHRVQAAILLHSLAETLGYALCVEHVVPWVEALAKDAQFRVRKAAAVNLGSLMQQLARDTDCAAAVAQLLSVFLLLARDEIWGVRKACCDNLAAISAVISPDTRSARLVPLFEQLAEDTSRWVRSAAFQALGPFIATFSDGRVDPKLLMYYRTMPHPSKHGRDSDIALFCAHNFPAVLLTLGGQRWAELSELYMLLVKDLQWKVRRTLAFSLHEVARIVGPQVAERSLLSVFDAFLVDLEEVKIGCVTHLAAFLAVLSPECRARYGHVVRDLRDDFGSWRFRELVASQMAGFVRVFASSELREIVVPACVSLARDQVMTVRAATVTGLATLLAVLRESNETVVLEHVLDELEAMRNGPYHDRQTFAQVCGAFLELPNAHPDDRARMERHLEALAQDKTPNVRLVVAQVLPADSAVRRAMERDGDWDVMYFASGGTADPAQRRRRVSEQ